MHQYFLEILNLLIIFLFIFEENKLIELQLFVGTVSSGNEYKFTLSKIDSSSVVAGTAAVVKESYTINVSGDDLVSNSWNTIDISSYNISIGEGETLGFGLPTDTLEIYYLTGLKTDGIYYGSTSATDKKLKLRDNYNLMFGVEGEYTGIIAKEEQFVPNFNRFLALNTSGVLGVG